MLLVNQTMWRRMIQCQWIMNYKDVEGNRHDLFRLLHFNLPGEDEESHKNLRETNVSVESRKVDLRDTSQMFYCSYGHVIIKPEKYHTR